MTLRLTSSHGDQVRERGAVVRMSRCEGSLWRVTLLLIVLAVPSSGLAIVIEGVDSGVSPNRIALALDPDGRPHVLYQPTSFSLAHASKLSGVWTIEDVTTPRADAYEIATAADDVGRTHVTFGSFWNWLYYGKKTENTWIFEVADAGWRWPGSGATGFGSSLVLDSSNNPHIAYTRLFIDPDERLDRYVNYAFKLEGGAWGRQIVDWRDTSVGYGLSLSLDQSDCPHMSYVTQGADLVYAVREDEGWGWETVVPGIANAVSTEISIDQQGRPQIIFIDNQRDAVVLASKLSGTWSLETIDDSGADVEWELSLDLDGQDNPHVAFRDASSGRLMYARKWNGVWASVTVDSAGFSGFSDLRLDSRGGARLAFLSDAKGELLYANVGVASDSPKNVRQAGSYSSPRADIDLDLVVAPNPFGTSGTRIALGRRLRDSVEQLSIFDSAGRLVRSYQAAPLRSLPYVDWDGRDDTGELLPPAVYFLRIRAAGTVETRRITLVR
jgi:hypothetical protein